MGAHVLHVVTGLDVGGAEWMLTRLASRLTALGWTNRVVSLLPPGPLAGVLEGAGVQVSSLRMRRGVPDPLALLRFTRLLRRERPDLVQTWLYHADVLGTLASRLARVPRLVWNLRTSDVDMTHYGFGSSVTRWAAARLSRVPDAIVVNSSAGRRAHGALGFRPNRWELIPNGVDVDLFRPDARERTRIRQQLGLPADAVALGVIARLDPIKGHEIWLRAAGQLARERAHVRFVLAGRGVIDDSPDLRRWVEDAGIADRTWLLGERHDIQAIDNALDVLVMPSLTEGFPNAVAEAMACGVPCVVTDVGDAAALVEETGWVAAPGDAEALADACRQALDATAEERHARGLAARARIEQAYSLDAMTASYVTLYSGLLSDWSS